MPVSGFKTKTAVVPIVAAAAALAFGYWGYTEWKTHQLRGEIIASLYDASARVKTSLASGAVNDPMALRTLQAHAEAVGSHFRRLHDKDSDAVIDLASAADDYLLTAREILLRRALSEMHRLELSASIKALRHHMRADDRTGAWVSDAIRAKQRVEDCYRDYSRAIDALGTLLNTFPASEEKLRPFIDTRLLADDAFVAAVRKETLFTAKQAAEHMESVRQLSTYR